MYSIRSVFLNVFEGILDQLLVTETRSPCFFRSTVTRVTKTPTTVALGGHTELSISHDGSQATWKSKFDYNASEAVASNSYLQIFHAKITMGCGQASATNYHADPDVKVLQLGLCVHE